MRLVEVTSAERGSEVLRLSVNAHCVNLSLAYFDPFDGDYDKEVPIGSFPIERLREALNALDIQS